MLVIRQAFAKAVLICVRGKQESTQKDLVEGLLKALSLWFGKQADFNADLETIVADAVVLANQMAEEQCLFQCFFANIAVEPRSEDFVKVADPNQSGYVYMCTFPGFRKRTVMNKKEDFLCLIPASVELASAFLKEYVPVNFNVVFPATRNSGIK